MTQAKTFTAELRDAIAPRTVLLVVGTLLLQLAFIASYVGAFHDPQPHEIAVGVVGPDAVASQTVEKLEALPDDPVAPQRVADRATAVADVQSGDLSAALIVRANTSTDELIVASGGGTSVVTVVEQAAEQIEADQGRTVTTTDVVPLEDGDARGLTGFYATIGWLVGGYLVASLLGVSKGARPANPRRAAIRLAALVPYSILAGLGGALILDPWFGALTGHFWSLWGLGTLLSLSAATITTALQVLFGTFGIGLAVLLFVVIGNPSAGGAFQWELLPTFWRDLGPWIPNGAGTEAVRQIVYFDGRGVAVGTAVIAAYALVGIVVTMVASLRFANREAR